MTNCFKEAVQWFKCHMATNSTNTSLDVNPVTKSIGKISINATSKNEIDILFEKAACDHCQDKVKKPKYIKALETYVANYGLTCKCTGANVSEHFVNQKLSEKLGNNVEKYSLQKHQTFVPDMSERSYICPDGICIQPIQAIQLSSKLYAKKFKIPKLPKVIVEAKSRYSQGTADDKISFTSEKYEMMQEKYNYGVIVVVAGGSEYTMHLRGYFGKCKNKDCKCNQYQDKWFDNRQNDINRNEQKGIYIIPASALV